MTVLSVFADSSAAYGGLDPHDSILAVDGPPIVENGVACPEHKRGPGCPMVVLVAEDTVSYGEIFSGVLQDTGRARVVGQTTLGNVEALHGYGFQDGSRVWIAEEVFDPLNSNADWEIQGIVPEIEVIADWSTFTFETDPAIAAALDLLAR